MQDNTSAELVAEVREAVMAEIMQHFQREVAIYDVI